MEASACVSTSRYPVMLWRRTWATCSTWTHLEEGLRDLQKPLPVPAIPWYFSNFNYSTQSLADLWFFPQSSILLPPHVTALEHRTLHDFSIYFWKAALVLKCQVQLFSQQSENLITPKQVNFKSLPGLCKFLSNSSAASGGRCFCTKGKYCFVQNYGSSKEEIFTWIKSSFLQGPLLFHLRA